MSAELNRIVESQEQIKEVSDQLKREFVNIDEVIDELITGFSTWYYFMYLSDDGGSVFNKPYIINLFGVTGTGKTALACRLIELMGLSKLHLKLDLSKDNFGSQEICSFISDASYSIVDAEQMDMSKLIVTVDEFQQARTIGEQGDELDQIVELWNLFDTGEFNNDQNFHRSGSKTPYLVVKNLMAKGFSKLNQISLIDAVRVIDVLSTDAYLSYISYDILSGMTREIELAFMKLDRSSCPSETYALIEESLSKQGLASKSRLELPDGEAVSEPTVKTYRQSEAPAPASMSYDEIKVNIFSNVIRHAKDQLISRVSSNDMEEIRVLCDQVSVEPESSKILAILGELHTSIQNANSVDTKLNHSLFIVIGNIDEAYTGVSNPNPDLDIDKFHEINASVGIPEVKAALHRRFRAEQIARLGSNFILYPTHTSESIKEIINRTIIPIVNDCESLIKRVFELNIDIVIGSSLKQLIYDEGTYPAQGARPSINTAMSIMSSITVRIITDIHALRSSWSKFSSNKFNIDKVDVSYSSSHFKLEYIDVDAGLVIYTTEYETTVNKLESIRMDTIGYSDKSLVVCVHEVGHLVGSIAYMGTIPESMRISHSNKQSTPITTGCNNRIQSNEHYLDIARTSVMGRAAEESIFGEDHTSGYMSDYVMATEVIASNLRIDKGWVTNADLGSIIEFGGVGQADTNTTSHAIKDTLSRCVEDANKLASEFKTPILNMAKQLITDAVKYGGVYDKSYIEEELLAKHFPQYESYLKYEGKYIELFEAALEEANNS